MGFGDIREVTTGTSHARHSRNSSDTGRALMSTREPMSAPTIADVAKQADDLVVSANMVWTLVTGFLVMFMQAGVALVVTGLTRSKNVAHTMSMNFLVYSIV